MIPHDYHHPEMEMASKGNGHPAIEPDWFPHAHDGALPIVSTVGAGPRGASIQVKKVESEDGSYILQFIDSLTGEVVETSPNLAAPEISITYAPETTQAGQVTQMHVHVGEKEYTIPIQAGEAGSRIYELPTVKERTNDDVYVSSVDSLTIYELWNYENRPDPRVGDVVLFQYSDDGDVGIAVAQVVAVESEQVVYVAKTYCQVGGIQGYSIRYLQTGRIQPTGEILTASFDTITPSKNVQVDDLILDRYGILGIVKEVSEDEADIQYIGTLFPRFESIGHLPSDCTPDDLRQKLNDLIEVLEEAKILQYDLPKTLGEDATSDDIRVAFNHIIDSMESQGILW